MPDFGTTLNSTPMDLVASLESHNRNIPQQIHDINTDKGTPAGGFFQIIDPTWKRYAPVAGIDTKSYPTAMSAPREVQAQVASAIPFDQWGPRTVAGLRAAYPGLNIHQPLGAIQAAYAPSAAPGPMDPSIVAHGGVSSPGTTSTPSLAGTAATVPAPTLGQNLQKGDVGAVLAQLTTGKKDAAGNETPGSSALDKLAGLAKPQQQQQQSGGSRGGEAMLPQDSTPMIGQAAQQLMAQTFANSAKPLSWSTMPYGSGVAGPQAPGTTLNGVPPNVYG